MRFFAGLLAAALLLLPACDREIPDHEPPAVRIIYPADQDTLGPGPNALRCIATDDVGVRWMSFWIRGEFIGIARFDRGDTWEIWWECSKESFTTYTLSAVAEDEVYNNTSDNVVVHIRR